MLAHSRLRHIWILVGLSLSPTAISGTTVDEKDLRQFFAVSPNGDGLPAGSGEADTGAHIYERKCAMCHGKKLEGVPTIGGPALIGGRGSLTSNVPLKTVESYWPFSTTLFDYIWRAMPLSMPGSLSANEVYALCAFILSSAKIIDHQTAINAASLPNIKMPNSDGFYEDPDER